MITNTNIKTWLLIVMLSPSLLYAVEMELSAGGAVEYSSNALRTDINQGSDTEQAAIVRFDLEEAGESVTANMNYSAEKRRYIQEKSDDQTVLEGITALEWRVLPYRLSLLADHDIRDEVADNRSPNTPDNRTKQQVVSVGAQFQARPSQVDNLFLLLRRGSVHFDELSGNDNLRRQATLSWQHLLTQDSSINIGSSVSDIGYDNDQITDYQSQSLFVGGETLLMHGDLSFRLGISKIKRDDLEDIDGNTYRLAWTQTLGSAPFHWGIYYAEELTDSSIGLIGDGFLPPAGGSGSNFEEIDILEIQRLGADFSYRFTQIRSQLTLNLLWEDQDYHELPNDEELRSMRFSLAHDFTQRLNAQLYLQHEERDFLNTDTAYDEDTLGIRSGYQLGRKLDLTVDIYHIKRDDTVTNADFEDNVVRLELMYTF